MESSSEVKGIKKICFVAGAIAAVVFSGAFAAQYRTGEQIEQQLTKFIETASKYGYKTKFESYSRGATSSEAVTVTRLAFDPESQFEIVFDHAIDHGPTLGDSAAARIVSTLRLPDGELDQLKQALDGKPAVKVVTLIHEDGSQDIEISAPQFEIEDVDGTGDKLVFGGLNGNATVAADLAYKFDMAAPSVDVLTSDGKFSVSGITTSFDGVPTDIEMLWVGGGDFKVAEVQFQPVEGEDVQPVKLDQLSVAFTMSEADSGFDIDGGYAVKTLNVAGETVSDIVLDISMGALDKQALKQYIDEAIKLQDELAAISAATANDPENAEAAEKMEAVSMQMLTSAMQVATKGKPALRFDNISFGYGGGRMDGNMMVQYAGNGDLDAFNPFTDISANLALKGTKDMIATIVGEVLAMQQYGARVATLTEEERNAVVGATQFQLDAVVKQGMLADSGEDYTVEATFGGGELLVNGAPMPIPGMPPPQ